MIATTAQTGWLIEALTDARSVAYLAIIAVCVALLLLGARGLRRLPDAPQRRGEAGVATIEFALVLPILLFLILLLTQATLAMTGNLFVHYAAFAATRSAIVNIPAVDPAEPANYINPEPGWPKYDAIRTAAALACLPISGRSDEGSTPADAIVDGLTTHYQSYGRDTPVWIDRLIAPRVRYAFANTDVTILRTFAVSAYDVELEEADDGLPFGPREPVTVRVEHQFALSVPYVWRIFAGKGDDRTAVLRAHYTLNNEGIIDALPPPPAVPRAELAI